jgi:3',5'-nucleoside bisphosphate phosphatase
LNEQVGIDLHVHSTASDGTERPADVIAAAAAAGLHTVALTDHDTTAGWEEAGRAARRLGIILVPGAEISALLEQVGVHLLAYLHDPADPALRAETEATRAARETRARRMVDRITVDYDLTWQDVLAQVGPDATVGRPHIADAMVAKGLVTDRDEAFATVLHGRSRYYLPHYAPNATRVLQLVRAAGGVTVLAHPRSGGRGRRIRDELIADLAAAGLGGIEVDHPDHDAGQRRELRGLAAELGLLVTGSSDYHGTGKTTRIGAERTTAQMLEALVAAGTSSRVVRP